MSTSCEIIAPSRSSNVIRITGAEPFNDGANDTIEITPDRTSTEPSKVPRINITPSLTDVRIVIPQSLRSKVRFRSSSGIERLQVEDSESFQDLDLNNVISKNNLGSKSKLEARSGVKRFKNNNTVAYGISNNTTQLNFEKNLKVNNFYQDQTSIHKSPPDLDVLDAMYKNNNVSIEYYSNPSLVSKNGLIEPLYIRERSTFEFNEKSFKGSISATDARLRSVVITNCVPYDTNSTEFFEDNIDFFAISLITKVKNKFVETYNASQNKFLISSNNGKSHRNKVLDMSWISNDNSYERPFQEKYDTLKSEIEESDYMTLNNTDLLDYYTENSVVVNNQYPKIYEEKYSTGYTYDRSKVQGLDSIAFNDFLE